MSAAEQRWAALLSDGLAAASGEDTPELETVLVQILRAATTPYGQSKTDVDGLPPGRADSDTVRAAANRLLEWPLVPRDSRSRRRRAVALLHLWDSAQRIQGADDPEVEIRSRSASARIAYDLGRRANDTDIVLLAGRETVQALYIQRDWQEATDLGDQVLSKLRQPHLEIDGDENGLWQELLPDSPDNLPRWVWRLVQRFKLMLHLESLSQIYRHANWDNRLPAEAASIGRELEHERPATYAATVSMRARFARRNGDSHTFRALERSLIAWAGDSPDDSVRGVIYRIQTENANALNDYVGHREYTSLIMANLLDIAGVVYADGRQVKAAEARDAIEWAVERGQREFLRRLGNAAYSCNSTITLSGLIQDDTDGSGSAWADEANAWLDIAEDSWRRFATNGLTAAAYSRIRNEWRRPGRPNITSADATEKLLELLAVAQRGGLRHAICKLIVETCEPADERAERALRSVIDTTSLRTDRGTLSVHLAKLLAKSLESAPEEDQADLWFEVEDIAHTGAQNHLIADIYLRPQSACDGYALAARARIAQSEPDDVEAVEVALEYYVQAIHCLSFALLHVSSDGDRIRMRRKNTAMLVGAARAAAQLGDSKAADLIMEAIRRERIGLILADLSRDPNVSDAVRNHAESVRASTLATPDIGEGVEDIDASGIAGRSGETQAGVREEAISQAEGVLGPLAAAVRMSYGRAVVARSVLQSNAASGGNATAILQLVRLDTAGSTSTFARQASWFDGENLVEHIDVVEVPHHLVTASPTTPGYFALLPELADAYLPTALRDYLLAVDNAPVRLMIVPTGAQSVPFEALPLSDDEQLIDRAVVTMHTSLTTIRSLLEIQQRPSHSLSTVVYDLEKLEFAKAELSAIANSRPIDFDVIDKSSLRSALGTRRGVPGGVLAMGVHGSSSGNGWGQTKMMPDGSVLKPADFMGMEVPRLCVLASCHSSIESGDGSELSGFPLAMFLSGATTVIGSLLAVPDRPTSEIMSIFWRIYGIGGDPVAALWAAKHEWFTQRPANRVSHRSWAGIVVYGGAHY